MGVFAFAVPCATLPSCPARFARTGLLQRSACHSQRKLYDSTTKACIAAVNVNCGDKIKRLAANREDADCAGKHFYGDTCSSKCAEGFEGPTAE